MFEFGNNIPTEVDRGEFTGNVNFVSSNELYVNITPTIFYEY